MTRWVRGETAEKSGGMIFWLLSALAIDVSDDVADGLEFFGIFVWDFDSEFFFEGHDELDGIEGIGTEIFN